MAITNLIAVDLGASSGRLISGQFDGDQIHLKEQFRFSNQPVAVNGHLYWDYLKIFQEIKYGLAIARRDL
ncbi:rhamnulokinase, partial [Salmonella enterica subsp. enterica serovar Istanbul]|nr:rhamnulokinase [Salmonella enterica subsp. enterica serovar Istanbul]